jgi:hypothetical protein
MEGWVLPALETGDDYLGLIRAVLEADDHAEQRLAELVLAMFLLGQNYRLTPEEYQELFTFEPESSELADSQAAFHDLAQDHIRFLVSIGVIPLPTQPSEPGLGILARVMARIRNHWPIRRFSLLSRKRGMAP